VSTDGAASRLKYDNMILLSLLWCQLKDISSAN
jgi:hypothetical protein